MYYLKKFQKILKIKNKVMKKLLYLMVIGVVFTSCQKEEFDIPTNYKFEMTGRCQQDINGYYHLSLIPQDVDCFIIKVYF